MSLSTEQSTQLREAVKSKLVEIGEYVDDQLTDYVMIMVTNKKSEKQMAEDLELFLGGLEQSTKFSSWLHSQLKLIASKPTLSNAEAEELAIQVDTNEFNEEQVSSSGASGVRSRLSRTVPPTTPTLITKPIASCIGAVIKHSEQPEDTTEPRHRLSSSVVKVSPASDERRRNSIVTLQSGKSMLFKAVDAANKSVTDSSNKTKRVKTDVRKPFHDDQDSVARWQVRADDDRRSGEENETTNEKTGDRRSIEHRLSFETKALKTLDTNQRKVEADSTNEGIATESGNGSNTKFIVTFAGLDDQYTNKLTKKRSFNEMNELDELDYDETYGDYPLESEEMEMDEDQMEGLEDEMTDGTHQPPRYQKKKPIRCSYWPACEKGNACMFIHPNKPCTTFPNCPFGQQCHYIHPNCRFDGFCTRPDCPYTHTAKKQPPPQQPPQQTVPSASGSQTNVVIGDITLKQPAALSKQPAAEAPKVTINKIQNPFQTAAGSNMYSLTKKASTNPQAASNHYKLVHGSATSVTKPFVNSLPNCKFGLMCKNPNCPFVHPNTSSSSQFKWVANKTSGGQQAAQQVNKQDSETLMPGSQLETNSSSSQQRSQFNMESTMPQELTMSTN